MTTDNTKLNYFSRWDIDQLIATSTVAIGSGTTSIYTIPSTNPIPEYEVQFQPSGSPYWYGMGTSSTNGTLAGTFTPYSYISGTSLSIVAPIAGNARYFVWADKVNY